MEEKLERHLDELIEALKSGIDFMGEQAPLFIQELMSFYIWHHTVWMVVGLMSFGATLGLFFWLKKKNEEGSHWDDWGFGMALSFLPMTGALILFITQLLQLIKVMVAPRLYLIEALSRLL